jgi:hypothetical protein
MADDSISVQVEGEKASGPDRRSVEDINREADEWAAKTEQYRRETAHYRQQSAQAIRDNLAMNTSLLESAKEKAEGDLREGLDYGDANKVIEAQRALSQIEARQRQNEYALHQANSRPVDPVEAYAHGRHERSAAWIRSHPEYVTDPRKNHKLLAADQDARAEGHAPNTDGYFAHIERFVGLRGATEGDSVQSPRARRQAERQAPGKVTIKLSREDAQRYKDTAESLGLTFNEYMRRKYIMDNSAEWSNRLD